ncbi:MAG TPA: hypothetical protein VD928_03435, partial [Candidatus Paceibacterota bacterium]|nr:hypothetical protein [Candidatus Paceibacterota bacterium]
MEIVIGILALLVLGNLGMLFVMWRRAQQASYTDSDGLMLLQNQLQDLTRTLDARVAETSKQVHETVRTQLGESARLIKEVTQGLTKLDE